VLQHLAAPRLEDPLQKHKVDKRLVELRRHVLQRLARVRRSRTTRSTLPRFHPPAPGDPLVRMSAVSAGE
jgi:hypothetical protein